MFEEQIKGLPILWACLRPGIVIHLLKLLLRNDRKDLRAHQAIGDGGIKYDLRDFAQRVDMLGECLAVCDMVGLFFALGASEDADQQIGKRDQQPIQQLLLEILEIANEQSCPFLFRKSQQ
jgi:hypothetical protein